MLDRLADEIAGAWQENPQLRLVLGHGSGSFGHVAGKKYGTRDGVRSRADWLGFAEVWHAARELNQLVVEALARAGLPAIAFPPSATVISRAGQVESWDTRTLELALEHGIIPVIQGDVIFDRALGGTILSTEELFYYLASSLKPERILLAGVEDGVWADYPRRTQLLREITPRTVPREALQASAGVDVTGGMLAKVERMLQAVQRVRNLEIVIFSGCQPSLVKSALLGARPGTILTQPIEGGHA